MTEPMTIEERRKSCKIWKAPWIQLFKAIDKWYCSRLMPTCLTIRQQDMPRVKEIVNFIEAGENPIKDVTHVYEIFWIQSVQLDCTCWHRNGASCNPSLGFNLRDPHTKIGAYISRSYRFNTVGNDNIKEMLSIIAAAIMSRTLKTHTPKEE